MEKVTAASTVTDLECVTVLINSSPPPLSPISDKSINNKHQEEFAASFASLYNSIFSPEFQFPSSLSLSPSPPSSSSPPAHINTTTEHRLRQATAPLLRNQKIDTFYYIGLSGFSVGGQQVPMPAAIFDVNTSGTEGVILDCGTAVTRLQTQAYNSLCDAFIKLIGNLKRGTSSISLFDTCYDFSSLSSVKVPTVAIHFQGGKSLNLPAKNYLIPVDDNGTFCFAFAPTSSSLSIIGNVQQQGTRITYDLSKKLSSFGGK